MRWKCVCMESTNGFVMAIDVEQWEYWQVPDMYDTVATFHACTWIGAAGLHMPDVCQRTYHCRMCAMSDGMCQSADMCVLQGKLMLEDVSDVPEIKVEVLHTCIVLQAAI